MTIGSTTAIAIWTAGYNSLTSVLGDTLTLAIGLVMGLAALFMAVKWIVSKTQGRRK